MTALSGWSTAGQQPASWGQDQARPMREGFTWDDSGQIRPAISRHRPASAHARKISGGRWHGGGCLGPCFRKKTEGVRVRGRIDGDKRASGFGAGGLLVI